MFPLLGGTLSAPLSPRNSASIRGQDGVVPESSVLRPSGDVCNAALDTVEPQRLDPHHEGGSCGLGNDEKGGLIPRETIRGVQQQGLMWTSAWTRWAQGHAWVW